MIAWLEVEILTGLQRLACLSLDRTPAAEMLPGTAQAWIEALTDGRAWDEQRDAPRVRRAFVVLSKTVRRWPAPAEFMDALPPPAEQPRLEKQFRPASPEIVAAAVAEVGEWLNSVNR